MHKRPCALLLFCLVTLNQHIIFGTSAAKYRLMPGKVISTNANVRLLGERVGHCSMTKCARRCRENSECKGFVFDMEVRNIANGVQTNGFCQLVNFEDPNAVSLVATSADSQRFYVSDPCSGDSSGPCENSGVCNVDWWPNICRCPFGYNGSCCETELATPTMPPLTIQAGSCKQVLESNASATSGEYKIVTTAGRLLNKVFCDMDLNGGGYTFISPKDLPQLTDVEVQAMFTNRTSLLWKVLYTNGTQKYGVLEQLRGTIGPVASTSILCSFQIHVVLEQLQQYRNYPLKLGLNNFTDFALPRAIRDMNSTYLYFGFVPAVLLTTGTIHGLTVNSVTVAFDNADVSKMSFMVLLPNVTSTTPIAPATGNYIIFNEIVNYLFTSTLALPQEYFMLFVSGFGGGGWMVQTGHNVSFPGSSGATIGFR